MKMIYDCPFKWVDGDLRHACRSHDLPGKHWCPCGAAHRPGPIVASECPAVAEADAAQSTTVNKS